jgi:hypothetical protein
MTITTEPIEPATNFDVVGGIMAFESGEMEEHEIIEFFQHLVDTGLIGGLQGSYQRTAAAMIEAGIVIA